MFCFVSFPWGPWGPGQPPCQATGVAWSLLPLPSPLLAYEGDASFLCWAGMLSARLGGNQGQAEAQQKTLQFCAKFVATRTKGALIQ